jgi:cell division septation protein DedD
MAAVQTKPAATVQAKSQPKLPAPPEPKAEAVPEPKPEPPPQPQAEAPKLIPSEQVPMITPQAGQRYIQVGALDLEATKRYIPQLRRANFEPHVAPGPRPELLRVLIGPFADQDSLIREQSELASAQIKNFVRKYERRPPPPKPPRIPPANPWLAKPAPPCAPPKPAA